MYLGSIYPKTGSDGKENLTKGEYKVIAAEVMKAITANDLFVLDLDKVEYKHVKEEAKKKQ